MLERFASRSFGGRLFDIVRCESAVHPSRELDGRYCALSPCGRGLLAAASGNPSPIRDRGQTFVPSPARGEGTKGETARGERGSRDRDGVLNPSRDLPPGSPQTRDTRKTRTATSRTAAGDAVSEHRWPLFSIDPNNEMR